MFYVEYENWSLTDLPTTVDEYREWCKDWDYQLEETAHHVVCYNKFNNERDANRYALTHGKPVVLDTLEDAWGC
jgi:hypothetical protein